MKDGGGGSGRLQARQWRPTSGYGDGDQVCRCVVAAACHLLLRFAAAAASPGRPFKLTTDHITSELTIRHSLGRPASEVSREPRHNPKVGERNPTLQFRRPSVRFDAIASGALA
jgi:hypothetical protein